MSAITFDYEGTTYTLEFNRETAVIAETRFDIRPYGSGDIEVKLTQAPDLFYCALLMHHPNIKRSVADGIFEIIDNKVELVAALTENLLETVVAIVDSPSEGKAISWKRIG